MEKWFEKQEKPYIHSVILSRDRPIRFNLELDISMKLLNSLKLDKKQTEHLEMYDESQRNEHKAYSCFHHVKKTIDSVLSSLYNKDGGYYPCVEATDHRPNEKYSYRMYRKLAFPNKDEYRHFMFIVKSKIKYEAIASMIDITGSMLRTPGSWKDDHQCVWDVLAGGGTPKFRESLLSYTDDCDLLPEKLTEDNEQYDNLSSDNINKAKMLLANYEEITNGNFRVTGEKNGCIQLKRLVTSFCRICQREHDNIDAFATIYRNTVSMRCFQTKGSVIVGYIGGDENYTNPISELKKLIKVLDKQKEDKIKDGLSQAEKKKIFQSQSEIHEDVKKLANQNDEAAAKIERHFYSGFLHFQGGKYYREKIAFIFQSINGLKKYEMPEWRILSLSS